MVDGRQWMLVRRRLAGVERPERYLASQAFEDVSTTPATAGGSSPTDHADSELAGRAARALARAMSGEPVERVFVSELYGAVRVGAAAECARLMEQVDGLGDASVEATVRLCGFDVICSVGSRAYRPVEDLRVDDALIQAVRTIVRRSLAFLETHGPKTRDGLSALAAEAGVPDPGANDFLTADTLWDLQTTPGLSRSRERLRLLALWRAGMRAGASGFGSIRYLGVFDPRTNVARRVDVSRLAPEAVSAFEREVLDGLVRA